MGILNGNFFLYVNTCKSTVCQCEVHVHALKSCWGIATLILKLGIRWRWESASCAGHITPQGQDHQYTLNKSWVFWGGDNFLPLLEIEPWIQEIP